METVGITQQNYERLYKDFLKKIKKKISNGYLNIILGMNNHKSFSSLLDDLNHLYHEEMKNIGDGSDSDSSESEDDTHLSESGEDSEDDTHLSESGEDTESNKED